MFLLRGMMWLASLPPYWAGWALSALRMPLCIPLLQAAWRLSGNGEIECRAINVIQVTAGTEPALAEAIRAVGLRPSPQVAATAGLLASAVGNAELAGDMLARGRALGDDPLGRLELLEFVVTSVNRDASRKLVDSLAERRDLNPYLTKLVAISLAWRAVLKKQLHDARVRAKRLLEIEEVPDARMVLWAVELQVGNTSAADRHLGRARMSQELKTYYEILGHSSAGNLDQARQLLDQLRQSHAELALKVEPYVRDAQESPA